MIQKNIKPKSEIDVLFINLGISQNFDNNTIFFDPNNITNKTLAFWLKEILDETKSNIVCLIDNKKIKTKVEKEINIEELLNKIVDELSKIIEKSEKKWKKIILWISILDSNIVFIKEVVLKLKNKFSNLIIAWWWASLKKYDEEFTNKLFDYWFDILNIWWWKEFIEILWKINSRELDINENIESILQKFESEWNILVKTKNQENRFIRWWTNLFIPVSKTENEMSLKVSFWEVCLNNCKYCIVSREKTSIQNTKRSISMLNDLLSKIKENSNVKIPIRLQDPNPQSNLKRLWKNLDKLNLDKIQSFTSFWDIYSFTSRDYVEELLEFIKKYKFNWVIWFWRDTIQAKNDWDIIWKTRKNELLSQNEYDLVLENFFLFLDKLQELHDLGEKIPIIEVNYIFHPDMDLDLFIKKIQEWKRISTYTFKTLINNYILSNYNWSEVRKQNKWNFIDYTEIPLKFSLYAKNREPSTFFQKYKNSSFLDIMLIWKIFGPLFWWIEWTWYNDFAYEILNILKWNHKEIKILKRILPNDYENFTKILIKEYKKWNLNDIIYCFLKDLLEAYRDNSKIVKLKKEFISRLKKLEEWKDFIEFREKTIRKNKKIT